MKKHRAGTSSASVTYVERQCGQIGVTPESIGANAKRDVRACLPQAFTESSHHALILSARVVEAKLLQGRAAMIADPVVGVISPSLGGPPGAKLELVGAKS